MTETPDESRVEGGLARSEDREADISSPAKVMRIGTMVKQLLEEVRSTELDEKGRERLAEIHRRSIEELEEGLSAELIDELERLDLPFDSQDGPPTTSELRIAPAQLVGWLECLFHGLQTAIMAQRATRQQGPAGGCAAAGRFRSAASRSGRAPARGRIPDEPEIGIGARRQRHRQLSVSGFFDRLRRRVGRGAGRSGSEAGTDDQRFGTGLWRHNRDRFLRAVDRYYTTALALHEARTSGDTAESAAASARDETEGAAVDPTDGTAEHDPIDVIVD